MNAQNTAVQECSLAHVIEQFTEYGRQTEERLLKADASACETLQATVAAIQANANAPYYAIQGMLAPVLLSPSLTNDTKIACIKAMLCRLVANNTQAWMESPESVRNQLVDRLRHIFTGFSEHEDEYFLHSHDKLLKDFGVASAILLSTRLLLFDLIGIPRRNILRDPSLLFFLMRHGGPKGYLEDHLDDIYIAELSEAAWVKDHLVLADYLRVHPSIKGVVAKSWLHDPQLQDVSPHLAFLSGMRMANGAKRFRAETTAGDIRNALSKSQRRRTLYENKQYIPTATMVIWLTQDILAWADKIQGAVHA